jgi:hypothetical protein
MPITWQDEVLLELKAARLAAREKLTGRSRVCARRAAGRAVKEYFNRFGNQESALNFFDCLVAYGHEPDLPDAVRTSAQHLVQKVDQNHNLPGNIDLIADAENLFHFIRDIIDPQKPKGNHGKSTR